ncbi:hypothetical protein ASG60_10860 [Methylobacterium sp. Leaf469]|uniref:hypothetical protein n=1 Tax=Methylobacterium sp. Leaf469 TaxID=1736387 RepID=UPI000701E57B|nr:hypothetical protein [Methylobacterium sp. Leaf469]KQT90123.1 hypothetical protein ASG60_10860 [Methylobacterium sp. Leaf469]
MTEPTAQRVDGHLFAVGAGVFVARYPLSTALPIPLGVGAGELMTWAFCGLGRPEAEPVVLLVFTAPGPTERLTVATHFHDLIVSVPPPRPASDLDPAERAALCPAVLGALTPATCGVLTPLLALLGPALSALAASQERPAGAPDLALAGSGEATLTGSSVPTVLMLRSGAEWRCARVARARLSFGAAPRAVLTLDPVWGEPATGVTDAALLVGPDGLTAVRVRP